MYCPVPTLQTARGVLPGARAAARIRYVLPSPSSADCAGCTARGLRSGPYPVCTAQTPLRSPHGEVSVGVKRIKTLLIVVNGISVVEQPAGIGKGNQPDAAGNCICKLKDELCKPGFRNNNALINY